MTVVFAGDGPARESLEATAEHSDADVRFLGLVGRVELPDLYSTLDVYRVPQPRRTQGLVALEANCCGTPVAGVDAGALSDTIEDGETGYTYDEGDIDGFRRAIERVLDEQDIVESAVSPGAILLASSTPSTDWPTCTTRAEPSSTQRRVTQLRPASATSRYRTRAR